MSKWTKNQSLAINTRTGEVLVSASAGSGKTSVMIERLVKLVIEDGVHVSEILCLTFTRSAAEEMRGRLKKALIDRAQTAQGEERTKIIDNLDDLAFADVTTIDAFCGKITKKYFEKGDGAISPTMASEGEVKALKYASAVSTLARFGESDDPVYYELLGFLGKRRGEESFVQLLTSFDEYLSSIPDPNAYLDEAIEKYSSDIAKNIVAETRLASIKEEIRVIEGMATSLLKYDLPYPEEVRAHAMKVAERAQEGIESVAMFLKEPFPEKPNYSKKIYKDKRESKEEIFALLSTVNAFQGKYGEMFASTYAEDAEQGKRYVQKFVEVTKEFLQEYERRLNKENLTDFAHVAHEALSLLSQDEVRGEVQKRYKHILIDEYQDTNRLQEEIISLSGGSKSLFVVGDEKQSIYGFRHADPDIFRGRKNGTNTKVINLSDNFRQDGRIIDVVNGVFESVMKEAWSGMDYEKERMKSGLEKFTGDVLPVEINVLDKSGERGEGKPLLDVYSVRDGAIKDEGGQYSEEAYYVFDKIRSMVGKERIYDSKTKEERLINYGDIVVLSRKRTEGLRKIIALLKEKGVPVGVKDSAKLTSSAEILVSFLRLIHDTANDEALAIVMLSPLFGFSENQLAKYKRLGGGKDCLYETFKRVKDCDPKLSEFIDGIEEYSKRAKYVDVHTLITRVIEAQDYLKALVERDGGEEECRLLLSYVDSLEKDKTAGCVSGYLAHFDSYPDFKTDYDTGDGDCVRFMTMHGAKGLEFPVVFLVQTGEHFSTKDDKRPVNYHGKLGIGMHTFFPKTRLVRENFIFKGIVDRIKDEQAIEEMRLLYVAMTRAKNRLYISGTLSKEALANKNERLVKSHLGFIQTALNKNPFLKEKINCPKNVVYSEDEEKEKLLFSIDLSYSYSHGEATSTPVKYTVTGLSYNEENAVTTAVYPSESAEVGTLYHKVMEHIPFGIEGEEEIRDALKKLVLDGIITREQADNVCVETIDKVLRLPVIKRASTRRHYREQDFLLHVKHGDVVEGGIDDEVVLQGIIDLLVYDDVVTVVDYKYSGKTKERLVETYEKQLRLYEKAVKEILGVNEVRVYLISLKSGECIAI